MHPPFKFCITVGGFKVVDKAYEDIYPLPRSGEKTHFLHVTGENDMIVTPERSATLIDNSPNCRLEKHPGGHCELNVNHMDFVDDEHSRAIKCSLAPLLC